MGATDAGPRPWGRIRDEIRARGLRWTKQRMRILEVLEAAEGHVTGSELVERCRERHAATTPSTVYRTLDVLEDLGYLSHSHASNGREEFHVLPVAEHAHLECRVCGQTWELGADEAASVVEPVARRHGFVADLGHLTILGRCASCEPHPPLSPATRPGCADDRSDRPMKIRAALEQNDSNKRWHVSSIEGAKSVETRTRRIEKSVAAPREGRPR